MDSRMFRTEQEFGLRCNEDRLCPTALKDRDNFKSGSTQLAMDCRPCVPPCHWAIPLTASQLKQAPT